MKKTTIFLDKSTFLSLKITLLFCFLSILLSILPTICLSQSFFSKLFKSDETRRKSIYDTHSDISFGIGSTNYFGDLPPYSRNIKSNLQNSSWNIGMDFTHHFTPHFSSRASLTWARLTGDDNKFDGVPRLEHLYIRNVHFRNDVQELAFTEIYNLKPESRYYRNRRNITPYFFAGMAIFHHNPMAKVPTNYTGSEAAPGEWVSLQPLRTEGQGLPGYADKPYSLINVNVHFGSGVKFKLDSDWDLGLEISVRYPFTDYLDDVGGSYAKKADLEAFSSLSAAMGHRENEKTAALTGRDREALARAYYATMVNPAFSNPNLFPIESFPELGGTRNSSAKLNDMYILTSFKIIYHIAPSIKCPVIR